MLGFQTKLDIRRHLRVPFAGYPTSGYYGGIRTVLTVGQLEYYMNNLQASEECSITGYPFGAIIVTGQPAVGDTLTATINSTAVTYTVQEGDLVNPTLQGQPISSLDSISFGWANKINQAALPVLAGGGLNFKASPPVTLPPPSELTLVGNAGQTFTLATSVVSAGLAAIVTANGSTYPSPSITAQATGATIYGYVPICNSLESAIGGASLSLQYQTADVVTFRRDEVAARVELYRWWCKQLGVALSVGPAPAGEAGMGSNFGIKVTV